MATDNRTTVSPTPLQSYLRMRNIPAGRVEATLRRRLGGRAPDRKTFKRWVRAANVRRKDMVRLLWAVRETTGDPTVQLNDIFDLDPDRDANWED
jgi:hypothetical protein